MTVFASAMMSARRQYDLTSAKRLLGGPITLVITNNNSLQPLELQQRGPQEKKLLVEGINLGNVWQPACFQKDVEESVPGSVYVRRNTNSARI